jgi:hypothetical protein
MMAMKQFLFGFLMLVMLTPSLACAMTYCPMQQVQTATSGMDMAQDMPHDMPCHKAGTQSGGPMLALDCMGVDLFLNDVVSDVQPLAALDFVSYGFIDLFDSQAVMLQNSRSIRGPPNHWAEPLTFSSAIILKTQRLRI